MGPVWCHLGPCWVAVGVGLGIHWATHGAVIAVSGHIDAAGRCTKAAKFGNTQKLVRGGAKIYTDLVCIVPAGTSKFPYSGCCRWYLIEAHCFFLRTPPFIHVPNMGTGFDGRILMHM